jgi:hypothetical protein
MKTQFRDSLPEEICNECGSYHVHFNPEFGFYKCEACGAVWGDDRDDLDYDEIDEPTYSNI